MFIWIHIKLYGPSLLWNMLGFFRQKQRSEKWGRLYCVDSVDKVDNALYQLHTENICVDKRWQRLTLSAFSENAVAKRWHFYNIYSFSKKDILLYISGFIADILVCQRVNRWLHLNVCTRSATQFFSHRPILRKYRGCRPISPFVLMPTFWLYITLQHKLNIF